MKTPETLNKVPTHYCPGCGHGIVHRLIAEIIDELDEDEDPLLAAKRRLGRERMQQFLNIKRNGEEPTN